MKHISRSGQVNIHETLLVVLVLVLIIVLGTIAYFRYSLAHVRSIGDELSEQESTILLASASNLAELRCHERDCLDTSKFLPFTQITQQHQEFYAHLLGFKKLSVEHVYPAVEGQAVCTPLLYNQDAYPQNCKSWTLYDHQPRTVKKQVKVSTYVSLYLPEIGEYRIGRLEVTAYA